MSPKLRQTIYGLGLAATSLLTVLSVWKVIDPSTASTLSSSLAGLLSLLGVGAAGTAAVVINKQQKNGTFDVSGSPAEQAVAAIQATVDQASKSVSDLQRVKDAVNQVVREVPVLGPLGSQILKDILD